MVAASAPHGQVPGRWAPYCSVRWPVRRPVIAAGFLGQVHRQARERVRQNDHHAAGGNDMSPRTLYQWAGSILMVTLSVGVASAQDSTQATGSPDATTTIDG